MTNVQIAKFVRNNIEANALVAKNCKHDSDIVETRVFWNSVLMLLGEIALRLPERPNTIANQLIDQGEVVTWDEV